MKFKLITNIELKVKLFFSYRSGPKSKRQTTVIR